MYILNPINKIVYTSWKLKDIIHLPFCFHYISAEVFYKDAKAIVNLKNEIITITSIWLKDNCLAITSPCKNFENIPNVFCPFFMKKEQNIVVCVYCIVSTYKYIPTLMSLDR